MTVYKMVEVVGTSGTSVSDAIRGAVERAATTLEDVEWFEVREIRGRLQDGEVSEYQVRLDIGFKLHAPRARGAGDAADRGKARKAPTRSARSAQAQVAARAGERKRSDLARKFRDLG